MTRFNRLHPYPAMIADQLATDICKTYIKPGNRVLDPFCGTGRTILAASERAAHCVGIDVNPLASIIVSAKASSHDPQIILKLIHNLDRAKKISFTNLNYNLEEGRQVEWFPPNVKAELQSIITWINKKKLPKPELFLVASILSATIREASYCRKGRWKLHRMSEQDRKRFNVSAWLILRKRLLAAYHEMGNLTPLKKGCYAIVGDARNLSNLLEKNKELKPFDAVITSPPYGDSFSTVQYGGMSGLSLEILKYLNGLEIETPKGNDIDNYCLGGGSLSAFQECSKERPPINVHEYWHGSKSNEAYRRVLMFLTDLELSCEQICHVLRKRGRAIFVVARRSTGGWRLFLDKFLIDIMDRYGLSLELMRKREIKNKVTPYLINRNGYQKNSKQSQKKCTPTMKEEYVLVFVKS